MYVWSTSSCLKRTVSMESRKRKKTKKWEKNLLLEFKRVAGLASWEKMRVGNFCQETVELDAAKLEVENWTQTNDRKGKNGQEYEKDLRITWHWIFFHIKGKEKAMCIRIFLFFVTAAYLCRMDCLINIVSMIYWCMCA